MSIVNGGVPFFGTREISVHCEPCQWETRWTRVQIYHLIDPSVSRNRTTRYSTLDVEGVRGHCKV